MEDLATIESQNTNEIRALNLSYLMLAQNLIRENRAMAAYRLGLPEKALDIIHALSPSQMMHMSNSSTLIFKARIEDDAVWDMLNRYACGGGNSRRDDVSATLARLHASIIQSSNHNEAADARN